LKYMYNSGYVALRLQAVKVMVIWWHRKLRQFYTRAKFTAGWPNTTLGPAGKMCILVGPAFQATEEMQPQYHCRIYRKPVGGRGLNCRFQS
jgi:hypothetical protein